MSARGGFVMGAQRVYFRQKPWVKATALAAALVMLGSAQSAVAAPPAARGWHGLGWDLPGLQKAKSVPGEPGALSKAPPPGLASSPIPAVTWPAPESAEVDLQPTTVGGRIAVVTPAAKLPVSIARGHGRDQKTGAFTATSSAASPAQHGAGRVRVETINHAVADKAGLPGTLLQVTPVSGDTGGLISVDLNYRAFTGAFGGDFGQRLRFVQYPTCLLNSPDKPECRTSNPVDFVNNAKAGHLVGELALPQVMNNSADTSSVLIAAEGDDKSDGGDFKATNLTPAGSWAGGGSSGDFTYSYPVAVPQGLGGKAPTVALSYSSGAVDGLTSATNNQSSTVGDGWNLSGGGYIERSYKSCSQDLGGNNGQDKTKGDLCWFSDNATMSLGGSTNELVKDKERGTWHPKGDDGSKIERLTGASNGAKDGEYWKVTTTDGFQYFFGLNHLPGWGEGKPETRSAWTEPVFGNNTDEPGNRTAYADSSCEQAWRWNVDYIVDPQGNAVTYYYEPETNFYALNLKADASKSYTRGGYLLRIEYGFNSHVADVFSHAPMQVIFGNAERCLKSDSFSCDPDQLNKENAKSWPDVPADLICKEGAKCLVSSPAYFSRKRYTGITTQVTDGGAGWKTVNEWSFTQSFPASGDGRSPALWLDSITQTGKAGGSLTLPPTTFHAKAKANRVDPTSQYTALTRNRIDAVTTSQGGVVSVKYAEQECVPGSNMPASPEANTLACYPSYWSPGGAKEPILDWFNKYPVTDVTEDGRTQLSQQALTHYEYVGGGAWHHDDNPLTDPKYRTWSQWRGFGTVKTTKGQASSDPSGPPVVTETRYLRGMDGDAQSGDGHRSVSVPSFWGEDIVDAKQHSGFVRESLTYLDGRVIADTLNDPWSSTKATATDSDGFEAFYTGVGVTRTRTWIAAANKWRIVRSANTFGDYGLVTHVEDDGDTADPVQATCTYTKYVPNTDNWILRLASQVQKYAGYCAKANVPGSQNILADNRSYFDGQEFGAPPLAGTVTRVDTLDTWPVGSGETFQVSTTGHDVYGRITTSTDVRGLTTTMAFTPATGGPVTQVATTMPPVSGPESTKFKSTKFLDSLTGVTVAEVDKSGFRTDASYDALGRLIGLWKPGHDRAQNGPRDVIFAYDVSSSGANSLATKTLLADGTYATTYNIIDGLGRTVQSQAPTPYDQGGRVVTDTYYDSQGRGSTVHNAYWNRDSDPSSSLLVVQHNAVPSSTLVRFDSAGRSISSTYVAIGMPQWSTVTKYDGDRVTTTPPVGGIATTVVSNGLGQKTQLLQYKDRALTDPGAAADVTTYTYTKSGKPATITDPTGKNTWSFDYDLHDRKTTARDPDTGVTTSTYDSVGQLFTSTDAQHRTLAYTYDNIGRKTAEYEGGLSGAKLAEWTYDTVKPGLPASAIRYVGGRTYSTAITEYDVAGRPKAASVTIPMSEVGLGGTYNFLTAYDPLTGAVRTKSSPNKGGLPDEDIAQDYGKFGNPVGLHSASDFGTTQLVSLTKYNQFGQVLRTNFQDPNDPNQVSVTNTYEDGTNRLHSTIAQRATASNYEIANKTYTYDQIGGITKVADTPQAAAADVQCYRHDYLQRLTDAWTPASAECAPDPAANLLGGAAPYWTSWTYDLTGNRRSQVQHAGTGNVTTTSTYPEVGQKQPHAVRSVSTDNPGAKPSDYSYDESGNVLVKGPTGAGQIFTYDAEGRTATVKEADGKTSSYIYDADGNRLIARDPTGVTLFVGDMELFVAAGSTRAVGTRFYEYSGQRIAERKGSTGLTWVITDNQGTNYATVDAANLAVSKRWQNPFGAARGPVPPTWPDNRGYLGGYKNPTGLTHLGARDYDTNTGRFDSVDPKLNVDDPQSMNGYAYSDNSPINLSDPSGLEACRGNCDCMYAGKNCGSSSPWGAHEPPPAQQAKPSVGKPSYPSIVTPEIVNAKPKVRRALLQNQFEQWSHLPAEGHPPWFEQFKSAFCYEFPDVRSCDPSGPSLEETADLVTLFFPWGRLVKGLAEATAWTLAERAATPAMGGAVAVGADAASDAAVAARAAGAFREQVAQKAGFSGRGEKIIVDENLPSSFAEGLRKAGYDARSVKEMGINGTLDPELNTLAEQVNAKVLTRDRGRQMDGGFGSRGIQVDRRISTLDGILRLLGAQ